jgi:hypothetical protein
LSSGHYRELNLDCNSVFHANHGTLKMIPLLNESAYTWSKLCQLQ